MFVACHPQPVLHFPHFLAPVSFLWPSLAAAAAACLPVVAVTHSSSIQPTQQGTVFSVPANMSTLEALSQMARDHKSSLGVTDPSTGQLISNLSVSDLRWVWVCCVLGVLGVL